MSDKKPDIVFILLDNIGWGAFGAYGGTIPTPRIDKMASEGNIKVGEDFKGYKK
jgi:arylsulfatase A-like enzyme